MSDLRIDATLTVDEVAVLCIAMGIAVGQLCTEPIPGLVNAKSCVRLMNKLLANSPEYIPYDESSFDAATERFPFRQVKQQ